MNKSLKHTLWFFMVLNLIIYAPCAIVGIADFYDFLFEKIYRIYIWQYNRFMLFTVPLVFTRIVYVNYLIFAILAVLWIFYIYSYKDWKYKYNYKMPIKEKIIYIFVWTILIIGVLYCEVIFWNAM